MNIRLADALNSLRPNSEWTCSLTYDSIIWLDQTQTKPTQQEVDDEMIRLEEQYIRNEYQRQRAREYPTWEEQMDILFHQGYDGWKSTIQAIKDKYPKPE